MKQSQVPHKTTDEEDDDPATVIFAWNKTTPQDPGKQETAPGHVEKAGVVPEKGKNRKGKEQVQPILKKKSKVDFTDVQKKLDEKTAKRVLKSVHDVVKESKVKKDPSKVSGGVEDVPHTKPSKPSEKDGSPVKPSNKIPTVEGWKTMISTMKQEPQIIQDLLPAEPGSYGIIAGRTGIGKTNIILHLGHCLATGYDFFGIHCEKVKVAILAFEGDPRNLRDRLDKIGASFPPTGNLLRFEILPIQNPNRMLEDVAKKLKCTHGVQVAILDPIKYLVPGDYLKPNDVASFIQVFLELLSTLKISAITSLPIKKPQDAKGLIRPADIYSIKGATEWVDSATFGILVEKKAYRRNDDEISMAFAKHRIASNELEDLSLVFNREACMYKKFVEVDNLKIKLNVIGGRSRGLDVEKSV